jgi:2-dehydro-3-deoxygluconokinase
MFDLVTFGEAMIRMSPPDFKRLEQTSTLDLHVGGTELNVAVGASRLGLKCAWVSKLPDNPLGRMIVNKAREHGVDISQVIWHRGGRAGLYFIEFGATPRPSSVLYDRANSSFSRIKPGELDWSTILKNTKCLHLTGITPAVSESAAQAAMEAIKAAKACGCKVSLDLNYRAKLWSRQAAGKALSAMMDYVDILITTRGDTETIFDITAGTDEKLAAKILERYPLEVVAISYREGDRVWQCVWSALAKTGDKTYKTRTYDIDIVDQVGRGDSFAAGFLYGYLSTGALHKALDYGAAFAALKHSIPGDFNWCTKEEVETLIAGTKPGVNR